MTLSILYFGMVAEATGHTQEAREVADTLSLQALKTLLESEYPALRGMHYGFSVNRQWQSEDRLLADRDEIALLPPFAGG